MTTHVRCGTLFAGDETAARSNATLGFGEDGNIAFVCDTATAPPVGVHDTVLDYSGLFVMPGLIDVHTHLAYGNAKSEEDIDLYQPMEFRALRATVLRAEGGRRRLHLDLRAGRLRADQPVGSQCDQFRPVRGPARHRRRPLSDDAAGANRLVSDLDRRARIPRSAGWSPTRTRRSRKSVSRSRTASTASSSRWTACRRATMARWSPPSTRTKPPPWSTRRTVWASASWRTPAARRRCFTAARAGVDLIFHATYLDDECIDAMLKSGSAIGPTMTFQRNIIDFTQPHEPAAHEGPPRRCRTRICHRLREHAEGPQGRRADDDRHG